MTDTNYTISMMYWETTHWNVYSGPDGRKLFLFAEAAARDGSIHYTKLETALLAQHCVFPNGDIAFPLKIIERFDAHRKLLKKEKKELSPEYAEILRIALKGHLRATNGLEIRAVKLRGLGVGGGNE